MRSRIVVLTAIGATAAALISVSAHPAKATDCAGPRSTCINDDALWPHAGPAHFVAVGSAETAASNHIGFGIVTSYLSRPIVLQLASPGPHQGSTENVVDNQANGTFLWSYGFTKRLELDLAIALTLGQSGTGLAPVTGGPGLKDTAVRDMRFGFAYAIAEHPEAGAPGPPFGSWGLVARFEMSAPTGDEDQFAGERTGVWLPSIAGDYRWGPWFAGAEVGARLRPTTQIEGGRIGSQFVGALGVGYDILPRELLAATLEAWALPTFVTPAEWQVSVRSAPTRGGDLALQLGGGGGLPVSGDLPITTPRFRFTLGLRWAPQ
jgi:OOP family OmpA-OmpF porin